MAENSIIQTKSKTLSVRYSDDDLAQIEQTAHKFGLSKTAFIRWASLAASGNDAAGREHPLTEELRRLREAAGIL